MRNSSIAVALFAALVACGPAAKPAPKLVTNGSGAGSATGSGSAVADTPPPVKLDESEVLPIVSTIKKGVLPNGLTYYVKANKKPEHRVQLWLGVNAGSVLEEDNQRGMMHLVEHIAFEGTKRFPKHDIQDFIERSGMRFGADLNAYTSFDETVYQLMVPTDDPKTVSRGIDVLRDWSADISFDPKEVIDERKIIEEERRIRNSAGFRMIQTIFPVAYAGSKYSQRLPIGTTEVINGATAEQLIKLYKSWYRPDLMAVVVVGDVDAAAMETEIKAKFADLKTDPAAPKRPTIPVETKIGPRFVVARDKEQAFDQVSIDYQLPHRPLVTIGDLKRSMIEDMFARLVSQRMSIIAKRPASTWATANVGFGTGLRPVDEMSLSATPKTGKTLETLGDLVSEIARVKQHGFSAEEIDDARAAMLQTYDENEKELETRDSRSVATEILRNWTTNEEMAGALRENEIAKIVIPAITNEQLVAVAGRIADTGRVVSIEAAPKSAVPTEAQVTAKLAEAGAKQMPVWEAIDLTAPLIAADPTPGKITGEKKLANDVLQWTLSNGATAYYKQTDFKKDEVNIVAVSNGGTSVVSDKDYPQALFASAIVNAMGVGNYGPEELAKKLSGKKADVTIAIDDEGERVTGESAPGDVGSMLQLMYGAFTEPKKDVGAFEAWKAQQLQVAALVAANVQAKFIIGAFDTLFDKHARIPLPFPTEKRIAAIDLDKVLTTYRARFANAADFGFVIVGAIDAATIKPLVEKYLASLPATKAPREIVKDVGLNAHKGTIKKVIEAGDEAKSLSMIVASASTPWSREVEADGKILQSVLNIELLDVLREKLGGTYTVQVSVQVKRDKPSREISFVVFEADPARAESMQAETWKTLDAMATKPVKDDTLAKVKEQLKKTHDESLLENEFWIDALGHVQLYGDDLATLTSIDKTLARVTAAQVQKSVGAFWNKTNRATIWQKPEAAPKTDKK